MAGRKDRKSHSGSGKGKCLSAKDAALWRIATQDVALMGGKIYSEGSTPEDEGQAPLQEQVREIFVEPRKPLKPLAKGGGLDRAMDERLRRGQMKIEARLDLHGLNQAEAQNELEFFILRAYERGRRCVLVITGKGSRSAEEGGVLKRKVPQWLELPPLEGLVLKIHPAKPQHGGAGALYILLRRNKN